MRQNFLYKKWLDYALFAMLIPLAQNNYAQSIRRQCISSYGSSVLTENVLIGQTAGQSFSTEVSYNGVIIAQGFQQPVSFSVKEVVQPTFKNLEVLVYPNPATRSITIASEQEIDQSFIRVTDISGKQVWAEKVPKLVSYTIDCASWVNGVYLITIYDSRQNLKTLRLIISK